MRAVVTGQVGLNKKPFLEAVARRAREEGFDLELCHIGEMMYAEAPDVAPGRILDLPLSRLQALRRSVFKDILRLIDRNANVLVNTHATFRWRHGLFYAFDYDQMRALDAEIYIVLVDNIDRVHWRMRRDGHTDHTLKDLIVWREEEVMATELLGQIVRGHGGFYIMTRARETDSDSAVDAIVSLMFRPEMKRAYLSFPMTHVMDMPELLRTIELFRRQMKRHFVCFDPGDLEEKYLCELAIRAAEKGHRSITVGPAGQKVTLETSQVLDIMADIDGQIYARDFKLIDQAEMIVSYIPRLEDGRPGLSSGVERELQHAHEAAKDVFVIWEPSAEPSPFITETATRVFPDAKQALEHFESEGYIPAAPGGTLFA